MCWDVLTKIIYLSGCIEDNMKETSFSGELFHKISKMGRDFFHQQRLTVKYITSGLSSLELY